jgi:beta-glucosidase
MSVVDTLLSEMTIEEKIGQLNLVTAGQAVTGPVLGGEVRDEIGAGRIGGVFNIWGREEVAAVQKLAVEETRLSIPLFFGLDVLHGHRTIFPVPLAEAGLFDPELWERTARAASIEAANDGISLTFAPMLDISRDPRWGRIVEGPGEDPLVGARFAEAKVRGFQGSRFADGISVAATGKHFCAGGAATAGRDYAAADISERALHEVYLPPFRAAVAANCAAIMPAFSSVAGVPMTAHIGLLRGFLRKTLGFQGVVISDYNAIADLLQHGVAADLTDAAALALKAGVDMDMMSGAYIRRLKEALMRGLVNGADIDAAVRRVLELKHGLGLFDDPYRRAGTVEYSAQSHRELARDVARRAITLLSNRGVLPLAPNLRSIAVIGPLGDARAEMLGPWSAAGSSSECVSILEGIKNALPQCEISFDAGVSINGGAIESIQRACSLAAAADVVLLCLGESAQMSGEAASRATLALPGRQRQLGEAVLAAGAPVIALLTSGRPLAVSWLVERADATIAMWFLGNMAGHAIADVLTGQFNPTARLPVTWPREVGQVPIFYSIRSPDRPPEAADPFTSKYLDLSTDPLFPFGHGLSFSEVRLEDLQLSRNELFLEESSELVVKVDAVNNGKFLAEETIFLFIHDLVASVAQPLLVLKAWSKATLAPGQSRTVTFRLDAKSFSMLNERLEPAIEEGTFDILVGLNADQRSLLTTRLHVITR